MTDNPTKENPNMTADIQATKITVNGVDYIPANSVTRDLSDSPVRIVILQRGWVMIGRWSQDGDKCRLDNASVIRKWGTTKGLGELVDGPTDKTILDPIGQVEFHILGVVASVACDPGWPL